jgi:GNAT superfamily N-acetyltransferase
MDDPTSVPPLAPGLYPVPAGAIANVVTYLEMTRRPPPRPVPAVARGALLAPIGTDVGRYLAVYRRTGQRWMWVSRLEMPEAELGAILGDAGISAFAVVLDGRDCGLLELDFRVAGEVELGFFGLTEDVLGRGLGRWLMEEALALAWNRPIRRFWLHTCTLDHPDALPFYRRSGFSPTKLAVEVLPDPRLSGIYGRHSFPNLPPLD